MKSVTIVFPHQLFKAHPAIDKNRKIFLIEEWLFFKQYLFHKQKLILHRASMRYYFESLIAEGFDVTYIDSNNPLSNCSLLINHLAQQHIVSIHFSDPVDNWLSKKLRNACALCSITMHITPTPNFLNTLTEVAPFFDARKTYFQTDFYIDQRKKRNLLLVENAKPLGGKWTFDAENRARFPKQEMVPKYAFPSENKYITEARAYVGTHFPNNYGTVDLPFQNNTAFYPTTHQEAQAWLNDFFENRFHKFGIYEDALVAQESILYHSLLTPMLNIGLLQPQQIIEQALRYGEANQTPLNSIEGFIRQIVGWREFIRIVYEREGSKQRNSNYWGFTRKIPASFWTGNTGIEPIDIVIKKALKTGYCHHIERLMVLGNFMLLCEFDPHEVHRWFMELFVDSYDWVMVPNVYGMTQFADGGLMTTKPYISGSNYISKMGDFKKGEWQQTWDGLFWHFMNKQRSFFSTNPRLGMLLGTFDRMSEDKKQTHLLNAHTFLDSLN